MKTSNIIKSLIVAACTASLPAHAATNTWSGSPSDGNWSTAGNWTTTPASTDSIVFGASTGTTISTATRTINNVTFSSGAPSYTINGTNSSQVLSLTGNGVNDSSANAETFGVNVAQLSGSSTNTIATMGANGGSLIFNGTYDFNSGSAQTSTVAFGSTIGSTVTFNSNLINSNGTPGAGNLTLTQSGSGRGMVVLNGIDTGLTGTLSLGNNLTAKLGSAGAVATGATITSSSNTSTLWLASNSAVNSFALSYPVNSSSDKSTVILDRATSGAAITSQTLSSLNLGSQTTLTFIEGSNIASGTPLATVSGTTTFGQTGSNNVEILNAENVNLSLGNVSSASGATTGGNAILVLDGNQTGNSVTGVIGNGASGGTVSSTVSSSTSQTITLSSATGFTAGMTISGTGITSGTVITGISGSTLTLSQATSSPSGTITGTAAFIANLTKAGSGAWSLTGANTYTGATVVSGGTLKLDFANSSVTNNILYNGYTTSGTGVFPTVTVNGGTLLLAGKAGVANAQTFGALAPASGFPFAGAGEITLTAGAGGSMTLNLSSITTSGTSSTGLLDFNIGSGATVNVATTNSGFVGDGVTYGGENQFAYYSGTSGNRQIVSATNSNYGNGGLTITPGVTGNASSNAFYFLTGSMTQSSGTNFGFGGFRITNTANSDVLNLNTGTLTGNNGNILYAGGFDNNYTITNGTISNLSGGGGPLLVTVANGGNLTIASSTNIADNGTDGEIITKVGGGTLTVLGAKTFVGSSNGAVNVVSGTYSFNTIASGGSSSGLGASSNAASNLWIGATLQYTGSGGSTDRSFTIMGTGATLDASGTGALTWAPANAIAFANTNNGVGVKEAQDQSITFTGTSTAANTFGSSSGVLADPTQGLLYVAKSGTGTWILSGANTYTGQTSISGGVLGVTGSIGSAAGTGSVLVGGFSGGSSTAILSGTGTINGALYTSSLNSNVGHIAPGVNTAGSNVGSAGTLTMAGAVTIGSGTALDFDLNTATTSGSGVNDLIAMTGGGTNGVLTIGGAVTVNFNALGTLTLGTPVSNYYTLISGASSTSGLISSNFSTGTITGSTDVAHFIVSGNNLDVYFTSPSAAQVFASPSPSVLRIMTGATTSVSATLQNTATAGSNSLNVSLSDSSTGGHGTVTSFSGGNPATISANSSSSVSGTFTAGSSGAGTWGITNTDGSASPTTASASGSVTVYSKSTPNLSSSSVSFGAVHQGATGVTVSTNLQNGAGTYVAGLQVGATPAAGVTTSGGAQVVAQGTSVGLTAAVNTSSVSTGQSYSIATADDSTITGASSNTAVTLNATGQVYSGAGVWTGTGGGTWGTPAITPANWTAGGGVPGLAGSPFNTTDSATFGNTTGSAQTITLGGQSPYLNNVTFNTTGGYNISGTGGGKLHLDSTGTATITNTAGSNTISAPVELDSPSAASVAVSTDTLTISGAISESGSRSLAVSGPGSVILSNASGNNYSGGTTISAGKLYVTNASGSGTGSGTIGVSGTGVLNLASYGANAGSVSGAITLSSGGSLYSGGVSNGTPTTGTGTGAVLSAALNVNGGNLTFALANTATSSYASPATSTTYLTTTSTVSFTGSGNSISLVDLTNGGLSLRMNQPYLLVSANSSSMFHGLVIETSTGAIGLSDNGFQGYVLGVSTGVGNAYTAITFNEFGSDGVTALANATTADPGYYKPYLYLSGGDLEVVPEPGTWALMLGGLLTLVAVKRFRRQS